MAKISEISLQDVGNVEPISLDHKIPKTPFILNLAKKLNLTVVKK